MSAQYTPKPWRVSGKATIMENRNWIASVSTYNRDDNARLIAAAPDLLDALKMSESAVEQLCTGQDAANCWVTLATIRAAIAKAVQP